MRKSTLIWLIVAVSLTVAGALIFTGAMCAMNWDFSSLSTIEYVTNTYEITEEFKDLAIKTSTSNVTVLPSPDGICRVECHEDVTITHSVYVDGETLRIVEQDERAWYENINIDSNTASITVYLPGGTCRSLSINSSTSDAMLKGLNLSSISFKLTTGDITITDTVLTSNIWLRGSTGDVNMENVICKGITSTAGTGDIALDNVTATEKFDITRTTGTVSLDNSAAPEIRAETSSGEVKMTNVLCNSVTSTASTGGINLKNVVAEEKIEITRSTGDVRFIRSDAPEICVTVDTGDVKGSLLSGKNFTVETSTGDVRVPPSTGGGACVIKTSTGDVNISIADNDQIPPTP